MQQQSESNIQALRSGPVVAASLALLLAFLTLMVSHHISRLSPGLDKLVHSYGYWIPGSQGKGPDGSIGSYTGKETLAIGVWLLSWLAFHLMWRKQDLDLAIWTRIFVISLIVITLGFFHPLSDPLVLLIAGFFGLP
ncbi:hypothetical protein NP603_00045 [Methylomonas sp. SURF-1]|uniref:Uncharacterized protein n=1 Tax=Methylomonas aurea TaxID=2952224 RepID=A0ABT1UB78_9GAMM|nr:hypothetical protein [Methylomonas sp. SURF-1]MCQ8179484.1 hypothetical protein [Methylomonas sp. SURF-1]